MANPRFVLRNYLAQDAIERAEQGDFEGVQRLLDILTDPYDLQERAVGDGFDERPPPWAQELFVSCSS